MSNLNSRSDCIVRNLLLFVVLEIRGERAARDWVRCFEVYRVCRGTCIAVPMIENFGEHVHFAAFHRSHESVIRQKIFSIRGGFTLRIIRRQDLSHFDVSQVVPSKARQNFQAVHIIAEIEAVFWISDRVRIPAWP